MEIQEIYLNSQTHKIVSLDKSSGMISHAYMIECSDRYLLDNYSVMVAKELFCIDSISPCKKCNNCLKIEHNNMVDLKIYPKDSKGIVVDDVNEIISDAYIKPIDSNFKVFILNNFDNATTQAQNKLLKTLEEPPTNVIFILTCTNSNAVLQTICSRVKLISESVLDIVIATKLLESMNIKDASSVASVSGGNIATAIDFASKGDACKIIDIALNTLKELKSSADILKVGSRIIALKKEFPLFLDTMIGIIRDISICNNKELVNLKNKINDIIALKEVYSSRALSLISIKLNESYNKLNFNCNLNAIVDSMLLSILEVKYLCQK